MTQLQSEDDQDQGSSLQTQSDPSPTPRRHLTRRDSLISKFFSRKKSERDIRTFSGQFPPPPGFCDTPSLPPPSPSKVEEEAEEHIYSVPQPSPPASSRPQSARTSLSQLHLLRSNSSAIKNPSNLSSVTSETSGSPPTNFKKKSREDYNAGHDGRISISSPSSSSKSVKFVPDHPVSTPNAGEIRLRRQEGRGPPPRGRQARPRSPPSRRSLKYSSLSSASPSSSPTSGDQISAD